ncbi:MAG TPA: single-stranded DNA-binding protein [Thermoanaerobaculaceae bacterium]|nr:single-stranded DNA-binding protein [Thermoanaerobaculaceae bacterium]HPS79876.1 single-stranded DNA-binding protein [Thermoanaerobaculaceae bacterium]
MSFHRILILGNVGRDVELRQTPGGLAVAKFSVATNEVWKDKNGQKQEHTEWFNIVTFGKQADFCAQYLAKGRTVFIEGTMRTRTYDDEKGNRKYFTEVRAQTIQLVGPRPQADGAASQAGPGEPPDFPPEDEGSEVPF